ncbi:MAG: translation initiation factor IF-2 [Lachnospiraceae bacterium]|nr:translation initiation factor IF-2 [Lachnospiraceae bacterium]
MAKQKIHELAKELNKPSKDIVEYLNKNGVEVKSHMSVIEDAQIDMVKKAFAPKVEAPKAEAPKAEAPKAEAPKAEEAPKKKKIVALYNAQNSRGGVKPNPQKRENERRPRPENGERRQRPQDGERRPRPENGERRPQQDGEKRQFNRDGQQNNGERRQFNRDGQNNGEKRQFNRDGQNNGERRPYNRDGQQQNGERRQFNREGQNNGERRPFNKDGQQNGDRRSFNKDFNKDKDNDRNDNRQGGGRRDNNRRGGLDIPAPEKPLEKNRDNNRHNQNQQAKSNKKVVDKFEEKEAKMNKAGKFQKPVKTVQEVKKDDNEPKTIQIPEKISVQDLAEKMKMQPSVIIKKMFLAGKIMTINTELDFEQAGEIAMEYNFEPEAEVVEDVIEKFLEDVEDAEETLITRPPVVCVMGHVDHGKTSLLDAIRHTNVTDREAGGITQHIGAYTVNINGQKLTFLDTPGHEAFTAMRMRGANSTDIAILVVAADDGVMPQTIEAISHAKAAGVEIIVAINKIDKEGANPDRVMKELAEHELIPEDWGGSTICVPVSAKKRQGIENLLEMVLLTAEMMELKANPKRRARGLVIEAELDKGKGPVATVLVQKGTLRVGDAITAGCAHGKVRAMIDDKGRRVKEAGPSTPVEILGFSDVPAAGDIVIAPETEKEARSMAEAFIARGREKMLEDTKLTMSLDDLYSQIQSGNLKELKLIIKADVQGSVEAVKQSLMKLSNEEVAVRVIHGGVGAINESDVMLANASGAIIIGFNVRPDVTAKANAERDKVEIKLYRVIYDAIADVERAMKGMLDPIFEEKVIGHAEIRQIFKASGVGNIAGSYVLDGTLQRGCSVRITREGKQIYEGPLASLKRFKDDVKEVKAGYECGLVFEKFNDIQELDIVEAYIMVEVPR